MMKPYELIWIQKYLKLNLNYKDGPLLQCFRDLMMPMMPCWLFTLVLEVPILRIGLPCS